MNNSKRPFVSVIIPVYNDSDRLKTCLAALEQQNYVKDLYEIVVVDNGSDDYVAVKQMVAQFPHARLTQESTPGSYAARNQGIEIARGDVFAFTDADCIPANDWIEAGVNYLSTTPNCGLVAGKICMFFQNPYNPTIVELYESVMGLPQQMFLEKYYYGATANMFTLRHIMENVGKFNSQLKSSGDVEWGQRVHRKGFRQIYAESVLIEHPTHASFSDFLRRTRRLAGGHYDFRLQKAKTFWARQLVFVQSLIGNLIPPVFFTINTLLDSRLHGIDRKLKVSSMMFLVRYVSAWETVRLKFGGVSSRA